MPHHLLVILERLARNGQALLQDKGGIAQTEGVALKRGGGVGPEVAQLGAQGCAGLRKGPCRGCGGSGAW
ncbi:hypothetical protein [Candidatus Electrothrix sp.]|uniref:hypothetical protein n=1 Tax=Candidatus Electrothrix sp. TaxID=2170559 RepID=UPI004056A988